jgi:hypothetical protein
MVIEIVGWAAIAVVGVAVVTGAVVGLGSIPDIRRYLRIRNM